MKTYVTYIWKCPECGRARGIDKWHPRYKRCFECHAVCEFLGRIDTTYNPTHKDIAAAARRMDEERRAQ